MHICSSSSLVLEKREEEIQRNGIRNTVHTNHEDGTHQQWFAWFTVGNRLSPGAVFAKLQLVVDIITVSSDSFHYR